MLYVRYTRGAEKHCSCFWGWCFSSPLQPITFPHNELYMLGWLLQPSGSSKADFIFVNDQCVNVHLCWISVATILFVCLFVSSFHFYCIRVLRDVVFWSWTVVTFVLLVSLSPSLQICWQENVQAEHSFFVTCASVFKPLILYIVPSVAWGEDGIDELHAVGYVYQELLVCTANFTYIYAMSLSALYSLCLLYTHIQHIE